MNYALAKELKEAGFPQETQWSFVDKDEYPKELKKKLMVVGIKGRRNLINENYNVISSPTLSELIEACDWCELIPKVLKGELLGWIAQKTDGDKEYGFQSGKTPQEAVARLYIALNKT